MIDDQGYNRATSFTGSERQRRDQGSCPAPFKSSNTTPKYLVPQGTRVMARNVFDDRPTFFTTTKDNGFDRFERFLNDPAGNQYEFRSDNGWVMVVDEKKVVTTQPSPTTSHATKPKARGQKTRCRCRDCGEIVMLPFKPRYGLESLRHLGACGGRLEPVAHSKAKRPKQKKSKSKTPKAARPPLQSCVANMIAFKMGQQHKR
jgi:hypothetical protein